jgi:hypothetical protein
MKNRKKEIEWNKDTKKMKKRDQVVMSRIQTGKAQCTDTSQTSKITTSSLSVMFG